jgi:deoxyribonuclease-2
MYADAGAAMSPSAYSLNDTSKGALTYTAAQLWSPNVSYVIWNDEQPGQSVYNFTVGHTKGFFAYDDAGSGLFVTHSIPLFPVGPQGAPSGYKGLGQNAWMYGQDAMCLTMKTADINMIAGGLFIEELNVYDMHIVDGAAPNVGNITLLANGYSTDAAACVSAVYPLGSYESVRVFSKSSAWNNELYSACVAPTMQKNIWVETWIHGGELAPSCGTFTDTYNVKYVKFKSGSSGWETYDDHSKWVVADDADFFCMGDINRVQTQFQRGGGTMCVWDTKIAAALRGAVASGAGC